MFFFFFAMRAERDEKEISQGKSHKYPHIHFPVGFISLCAQKLTRKSFLSLVFFFFFFFFFLLFIFFRVWMRRFQHFKSVD